jgi:3-isopropylmalate dehydrogenase
VRKKITVIPGDGIGKEVTDQAVLVLNEIGTVYGHEFELQQAFAGGAALDARGVPLPAETLDLCRQSDAVLLGALGGPRWDNNPQGLKPENGLLGLREGLGLFANLRPAKIYPTLANTSSLKREVVEGVDLMIVRELTGGIYFGKPRGISKEGGEEVGINTEVYRTSEIRRVAKIAFQIARKRRHKVTSVDKANVLECSQLWRRVVTEVARDYPDVELNHFYVDNCAMQLISNPRQFDVIITTNLFGDILSDEAAMLTGSIGMLPSASLGGNVAMYEPVHGSAPDIAEKDLANPIAAISSVAMMLRYSFTLQEEADCIERSIVSVLEAGYRTADLKEEGRSLVGTKEMGQLISQGIRWSSPQG